MTEVSGPPIGDCSRSAGSRAVPYVLPFGILIFFLAIRPLLDLPPRIEFILRAVLIGGAILLASRKLLRWEFSRPLASIGIGLLVFLIWMAPDWLIPGWRDLWLFRNSVTGSLSSSIPARHHSDVILIVFRCLQAIILVPIAEELCWRGWLLRWLDSKDFERLAFGAYTMTSFWISAILFGAEHGPLWEVGILAGIVYNWWAKRTGRLADCILAHAATNAALAAYVLIANRWEYWS
ncbi:MAG: CAAX prenyl protease-related protein [Acidobacteria bacterium]|nr:CAAX prenyl protease-related protein [Acidobacteriota bacterium]